MKILMFFHGGSRNRGCEAIVRSAIPLLKSNPLVTKLALASADPNSDSHLEGLDVIHLDVPSPIEKYSPAGLRNAFHFKVLKDETYGFRQIHKNLIKLIPQYDVFLSIGGDNYCYGEQPGIYELDRQIKMAGKKLILWGASIGAEDLSPAKIKDLKSFDLILARESITMKNLQEVGLNQVKLVADGAFLLEKTELPLPQGWKDGKVVGFNFSPLVYKKNPNSKAAAFQLVRHILETTDFMVCLVPHVMLPDNDDYTVLQEFYDKFKESGRIVLLPPDLDATEYKGYIARMRFFIGARTHATIAAYSSLVPTMVLGYSVKSKGIAQDIFGEEKLILNLSEISDHVKLIAIFEEMKNNEYDLKEILHIRIPEIRENAEKVKNYL